MTDSEKQHQGRLTYETLTSELHLTEGQNFEQGNEVGAEEEGCLKTQCDVFKGLDNGK